MGTSFYLYILQSEKTARFYVGQISHPEDRLRWHNQNRSKFTKGQGPWHLVYLEEYSSRKEAVKREREIKAKKSRLFIENLIRKASL